MRQAADGEVKRFQHVAGELVAKGYPVARYDIGNQDSEPVQQGVAHLVCTRLACDPRTSGSEKE